MNEDSNPINEAMKAAMEMLEQQNEKANNREERASAYAVLSVDGSQSFVGLELNGMLHSKLGPDMADKLAKDLQTASQMVRKNL